MKNLLVVLVALLAASCSQQRAILPTPQETVYRYTTVYEGNQIIKYERTEQSEPKPKADLQRVEPNLTKTVIHVERRSIQDLPKHGIKQRLRNEIKKVKTLDQKDPKSAHKSYAESGNWFGTHPGTISILLFGLGILLSVIGVAFSFPGLGIVLLATFLGALVFSIIGVTAKNSRTDVALAWTVLILYLVGLLLSVIALVAFFSSF